MDVESETRQGDTVANRPLERLGFLTIGTYDEADPAGGHEATLQLIERAEALGFDSVWLRNRHFQHGISSPLTVLAAASQRTSRIHLGTAVIPLGAENPVRLAEDLATVDLLSGGRLNPGISVGTPMGFADYRDAMYPGTWELEELGYPRAERLLAGLGGEPLSTFEGTRGIEQFVRSVQPHAAGLTDRVWYGAGSLGSARWAGRTGLNLLTSSVVKDEGSGLPFAEIQRRQIEAFRAEHPLGEQARVSQGLVVIPTDSATPEQEARYRAYAESRLPRTFAPQGPAGLRFAPDIVGTSEQIAARLSDDPAFQLVGEAVFALPFTFAEADYRQIVEDLATRLGPALGWRPSR